MGLPNRAILDVTLGVTHPRVKMAASVCVPVTRMRSGYTIAHRDIHAHIMIRVVDRDGHGE